MILLYEIDFSCTSIRHRSRFSHGVADPLNFCMHVLLVSASDSDPYVCHSMIASRRRGDPASARKATVRQTSDDGGLTPRPPKFPRHSARENENGNQISVKSPRMIPITARPPNPRFRVGVSSPRPSTNAPNPAIPNAPITGPEAASKYACLLNNYEMREVGGI
jgi:hypothetical protein